MNSSRRQLMVSGAALGAMTLLPRAAGAPIIESGRYRVVTGANVPLPYIGTVRARSTDEIKGSNWLLGCETLDRDFADYDAYKGFIAPLGIKRLRMQAGWAKTEKVRGRYDFAWLDHIIDDASARGFQPWLQTSYGNTLYPGGGGDNLGAGLPVSAAALAAYDRWVAALVTRYRDKVVDWEVWNEPNFGDNTINSPEATADFNIRTARIIKRLQPEARISGLALGHYNQQFVDRFFARLAEQKQFGLFDNMTYHDYIYNPDANRIEVALLRVALDRHAPGMRLRQGENGAPSVGGAGGALWDNSWSELTQAKWNTRRMLGNLGQDIESSVFGLVDMSYTQGPINRMVTKGILKADPSKRVIRPKTAYYSIQNITSIFDDQLERIKDLQHSYNVASARPGEAVYSHSTDRRLAVFGYRHRASGRQIYSIWQTENIPMDANAMSLQEFSVSGAAIGQPVWIDIITGAVHDIPPAQWTRKGDVMTFRGVPVYDAPVLVADKSLIALV